MGIQPGGWGLRGQYDAHKGRHPRIDVAVPTNSVPRLDVHWMAEVEGTERLSAPTKGRDDQPRIAGGRPETRLTSLIQRPSWQARACSTGSAVGVAARLMLTTQPNGVIPARARSV
jgi:hypothetical protein